MHAFSLFKNPRILAVTLLGFSSGLPLALTGSTLQAWFTQSGVSLLTIGALTLVGMPYIWKFLWSPIMDRFVPPLWGRRRGWIGLTQLGLCITLFMLANLDPKIQPSVMGVLALVIAFISASQDIAIDAYRTDTFLPEERGMGSAWFIFTARMASLVSGGLALILADHLGWRITYELMSVLLAVSIIVTYFSPDIPEHIRPPKNFMAAIVEPFRELFAREAIVAILIFIVLYKLGDALALSLMSSFLLRGLGFSLTEIGFAYKLVSLVASVMGALAGGVLLTRLGLYRSLLYFGIMQAFSNLMFVLLAVTGKNLTVLVAAMFIENFSGGMSTTALLVLMTGLCNQRYSATQFACLSAVMAIGRVFLGPVAAVMVKHLGWAEFYGWTFIICFPGIILLIMLRNRVTFNAEAIA